VQAEAAIKAHGHAANFLILFLMDIPFSNIIYAMYSRCGPFKRNSTYKTMKMDRKQGTVTSIVIIC
jgi:hypothetical protein